MAVATETTSSNGKGALGVRRREPAVRSPVQRRRQVPWVVAGVLLVVGCALAFGVLSLRTARGEEVLAVARPVSAGQVVAAGDLEVVRVSSSGGISPVPASSEAGVVGRPAAVALLPGTLLVSADLGAAPPSAAGFDVVAMALKAGAYPPSLAAGDKVEVVPVGAQAPSASVTSGLTAPYRAVVVAIDSAPASSTADAVISLEVAPAVAAEIATLTATGNAALVQLPTGSGS